MRWAVMVACFTLPYPPVKGGGVTWFQSGPPVRRYT